MHSESSKTNQQSNKKCCDCFIIRQPQTGQVKTWINLILLLFTPESSFVLRNAENGGHFLKMNMMGMIL
jgi:hypothetical protein